MFLNEHRWRYADLEHLDIAIQPQGPEDPDGDWIFGHQIEAVEAQGVAIADWEGLIWIPYHRVLRVILKGVTVWERQTTF